MSKRILWFFLPIALLLIAAVILGLRLVQSQSADALGFTVLTNRYNIARTGTNLNETLLNTQTVNGHQFGKLFERPVLGDIYAMPLYIAGLNVPGKGARNVVFVATTHNNVYAFDADDPLQNDPYWHINLGTPFTENLSLNDFWGGEDGIVSTPVIDLSTDTMYVVSHNCESAPAHPCTIGLLDPYRPAHKLHALDIRTGEPRPGSPVTIQGVVPGLGARDGTDYDEELLMVRFNSFNQLQRPGLLLLDGVVYMGFGGSGDRNNYHGWIMGYDATTLEQRYIFSTTPENTIRGKSESGGVWQSGTGLSSDGTSIYAASGNGTFNADLCNPTAEPPVYCNYGTSMIRLNPALEVQTYFTPSDFDRLTITDLDIGLNGMLLLPGTNFAMTGSKQGILYIVDRENMGGVRRDAYPNDPQIVQQFCPYGPSLDDDCRYLPMSQHMHTTPVSWDDGEGLMLYLWTENDYPKAFRCNLPCSQFDTNPASVGSVTTQGMPSGILSLSGNQGEAGSAVVWATVMAYGTGDRRGRLFALDAADLSHMLWSSEWKAQDAVGMIAKFNPPMVADGKLYVASFSDKLNVYGLVSPEILHAQLPDAPDQPVTLTWSPVSWASGYDVQVSRDDFFRNMLPLDTAPAALTPSAALTLTPDRYYWRVRVKRVDGYTGPWSATQLFVVGDERDTGF